MPVADVRGGDSEVILHSDGTLSRAHLRIAGASGGCKVEDLDSTNGTFVDGRRVKKPVALSPGSIVLFGNHAGVFRRVSDDELAAIEEEAAAPLGPVATVSPALAVTVAGLRRLAAVDTDLLFVGETGVGKEVYARAVHAASGRPGRVRRHQLRVAAVRAGGERAVRLRARRALDRDAREAGAGRAGGRRDVCCSTRSATCRRACR